MLIKSIKEMSFMRMLKNLHQKPLRDINYRDEQDSKRAASPLIQVPEAIVIDTGKYDIEGTKQFLLSHLDEEDK